MLERIFVFFFGSLVGSFLNVCIHRLPLGESIVMPGSHCPACKKPIPWYFNIPLVSYWWLGRRCAFCKQPIRPRYFLVELLTALTFLGLYLRYGPSFDFLVFALFLCGLIVATFVDIQHRIIPDEISLGGTAAGLLLAVLRAFLVGRDLTGRFSFAWPVFLDALIGAAVGAGVIFLVGFLFDQVYFKLLKKPAVEGETESMGGGDVKLLAMIGAFLGWQNVLLTFFLAPFLGLVIGMYNLVVKKQHLIPYGPFLSLAAVIAMLWGPRILDLLFFRQQMVF